MKPTLTRGRTQILRVPEAVQNIRSDPKIAQQRGLKMYGEASTIIKEKLFLGSCFNARDHTFLSFNHITHIINVAEEIELQPQEGIHSYKNVISDEPKDISTSEYLASFMSVVRLIDKILDEGGVCVVHCKHGRSRSASAVIAYLMWKNGTSFSDTLTEVQQKRPLVKLNRYLLKNLREMEQQILNERSFN